jgi:hypothetical protein
MVKKNDKDFKNDIVTVICLLGATNPNYPKKLATLGQATIPSRIPSKEKAYTQTEKSLRNRCLFVAAMTSNRFDLSRMHVPNVGAVVLIDTTKRDVTNATKRPLLMQEDV